MVEGAHQDTRPHTHQNPFQLAQIYPSKVERKESAKNTKQVALEKDKLIILSIDKQKD